MRPSWRTSSTDKNSFNDSEGGRLKSFVIGVIIWLVLSQTVFKETMGILNEKVIQYMDSGTADDGL